MIQRSGVWTGLCAALAGAGTVGACWWLVSAKGGDAAKPAASATPASSLPAKPFKEDQATAFTLTPDQEARVAVGMGKVEIKPARRVRAYGGDIVVPPGRSVVVSAPLAGVLRPVAGAVPASGMAVAAGQPLYSLLPLLTPEGRANLSASNVEAEGQVNGGQEQLRAALITLERAEKVLKTGGGRQRDVDDARAQVEIARKALEASTARRDLLRKVVGDVDAGTTAPISIPAPQKGVLRSVSALAGQTVPAGAVLFEVLDAERVWVRVPVFAGDVPELDPAAPARVQTLTARPRDPGDTAAHAVAPPSANPATGTVDLFYDLDNRTTKYSPGQRVSATIPLKGEAESATVPWGAVVFDYGGGAWVYARTGERTYARRRVVVSYVVGDNPKERTAVLERKSAPPAGTVVVTAGTAELFGHDAGFGK